MDYRAQMRNSLLLLAILSLAATGCRTTHEADADELQNLSSVDGTLDSGTTADADMGQFSLGSISAVYSPLRWLSNKDRANGSSLGALTHSEAELALLPAALFLDDGSRNEWPDCVTDLEDGVIYDDCVLGAGVGNVSVGFSTDGEYHWTDSTSTAELLIDFGADVGSLGVGTSFDWLHDIAWTDTTLDGTFELDYVAGVTLGGQPSATSVSMGLTGSIESLTTDEVCDGPVAGILDWRSRYREGTDPIETTHVTVEWTACGEALVTW